NGPSKIFSSARFYFDEDEGIAIATNDIDFAAVPRPEITVKNSVAFAPEKGAGQFFPARTEPQMVRAGLAFLVDTTSGQAREVVASPVRKIGDGSGYDGMHQFRSAIRPRSPRLI